jgi:hypothetical protein
MYYIGIELLPLQLEAEVPASRVSRTLALSDVLHSGGGTSLRLSSFLQASEPDPRDLFATGIEVSIFLYTNRGVSPLFYIANRPKSYETWGGV